VCILDLQAETSVQGRTECVAEKNYLRKTVKEMLERGVIRPSSSPWAASIVLVPRIDEALDAFGKASYFKTLDLVSGYWQVPMHPNSRAKTAFITSDGLYEWLRMPFGLCNAPTTFQRFMDAVLTGYKWQTNSYT
jgi:hypothetical protein